MAQFFEFAAVYAVVGLYWLAINFMVGTKPMEWADKRRTSEAATAAVVLMTLFWPVTLVANVLIILYRITKFVPKFFSGIFKALIYFKRGMRDLVRDPNKVKLPKARVVK